MTFPNFHTDGMSTSLDPPWDMEKTAPAVIAHLNGKYIDYVLAKRVKQLQEYIGWQTDRIKNWKPAPLTPVKK